MATADLSLACTWQHVAITAACQRSPPVGPITCWQSCLCPCAPLSQLIDPQHRLPTRLITFDEDLIFQTLLPPIIFAAGAPGQAWAGLKQGAHPYHGICWILQASTGLAPVGLHDQCQLPSSYCILYQ